MITTSKIRRAATVAASAALLTAVGVGAAPAFAATTAAPAAAPAADPIQCDGDLCIQNISQGVFTSTIKAWAKTTTFTGHFELKYSDGAVRNSPTRSWRAGGTGYDFTDVPVGDGYTMIAWKGTSNPFTNIGTVGFSVG